MSTRMEDIESAMRAAMDSLTGDDLTTDDRIEHLVNYVMDTIPDVTEDEFLMVKNIIRDDLAEDLWVAGQIREVAARHGWRDEETVGDVMVRAAAAGDEQAKKLIEMGIVDTRLPPIGDD